MGEEGDEGPIDDEDDDVVAAEEEEEETHTGHALRLTVVSVYHLR